jgi:hypothetical protein
MTDKKPVEFTPAQVVTIFKGALDIGGDDVPKAYRLSRMIKKLDWIKTDQKSGGWALIPPKVPDAQELQLKPTDIPAVYRIAKFDLLRGVTPGKLDMLECFAEICGEEEDFAKVQAEYEDEDEQVEEGQV